MILMVSARTDIPAFYSDWFYNRLDEGYVIYKNPYNNIDKYKISLRKEDVTCFIFISKNPRPFMKNIDKLDNYNYLFHYSLTSYSNDIETNLPKGINRVETFKELSDRIGKEKIIWRYDPIIITDKYTIEYHIKVFEKLANMLHNYTNHVIISFVDLYDKVIKNMKEINYKIITTADMKIIGEAFGKIAMKYNLEISTCAEEVDLNTYGITNRPCITHDDITKVTNQYIYPKEYSNLRTNCKCVKTIDIGEYNTCLHLCKYCYANDDKDDILEKHKKHDKNSNILIGSSVESDGLKQKTKIRNLFNIDFGE